MIKDMPIFVYLGSTFGCFVQLALALILLNYKKYYSSPRFWISTILMGIYATMSYLITDNVIRILLLFLIQFFLILFVFKFKLKMITNVLFATFFVWIVNGIIDVLYSVIFVIIFKNNIITLRDNIFFIMFSNALVFFTCSLVFYNKKIRLIFSKIGNQNNNKRYIFTVILLSAILFSVMFYVSEFHLNTVLILSISFIMVVIYTIVVIITIRESNERNSIQSEYNILLTNLSEYENLLDRQRISNHENKNQLLVIRGMIDKKENAIEYIDSLVDNQYKDSDDLIMKTNRIPSGGLKGLIYYKTLVMKDKKINVNLEVNSIISKIDFSIISTNTNQELCKIVGVLLDNAIQEVENLDNGNINIVVESIDDSLLIKISNNYGYSDINKIGDKGYTTKGNGHGYGLRLVKNIIDNNKKFSHKTEITGKVFSQIITLKLN